MISSIALASAALVASVAAVEHKVVVGGSAGLVFTPEEVTAVSGDTVTFIFQTKNHTVTQSGFASPCQRLMNATTNSIGFASGFQPVKAEDSEFPAYTIEVTNDKAPIWYYCAQGPHCVSGMVGAINAPKEGEKTFAAFKALAMSNVTTPPPQVNQLTTIQAVTAPAQTGVGASGVSTGVASPSDVQAAQNAAQNGPVQDGGAAALKAPTLIAGLAAVAGLYSLTA